MNTHNGDRESICVLPSFPRESGSAAAAAAAAAEQTSSAARFCHPSVRVRGPKVNGMDGKGIEGGREAAAECRGGTMDYF